MKRYYIRVIVVCAWITISLLYFYLVVKPVREPSIDFFVYYASASALRQGMPLYTAEAQNNVIVNVGIEKVGGPYNYPPLLAILMQPVLIVSPYTASLIWFWVNVGLLLAILILLFRQFNFQNRPIHIAMWLLPLFFTPVLMTLFLGQINILIFVFIVLAYVAFIRKYPYICGGLLALLVWIKIWPLVLILYFIWKREKKVLVGALAGLIVIGLFTVAIVGTKQTIYYFTDVLPYVGHQAELDHLNQSIVGAFAKLFNPTSQLAIPIVQSSLLAKYGSTVTIIILVGTTIIMCSKPIRLKNTNQLSDEFILVMIATLLITEVLWESSLIFLLLAYFIIAQKIDRTNQKNWRHFLILVSIISILLIDSFRLIWVIGNPDKEPLPSFFLIGPFLGCLLLWFSFAIIRIRTMKYETYSALISLPNS